MRFAFTGLLCALLFAASLAAAPAPKSGPARVLVVASNKSGNWEIYLIQPGSGETKQLTDNTAADTEPIWSPDGKRIAFVSDRGGDRDIWLMNADGTKPEQLTKKCGGCTNLRWAPDGKRIAFVGPKNGVDQIQTVEVATGTLNQLTTSNSASRQPAWSPDSKQLSFSHYAGRFCTYVMPAEGKTSTMLTDMHGGLDAAWAPNGRHLAYVAITGNDGGWMLFTIGPDGKNKKQLTKNSNTFGNVYPQWSPDGTRISFGELVDGVLQVAVVSADGSDLQVITSKHQHSFTRWSPDGKSISYMRNETGKPAALWVSDADGGNPKELITHIGNAPAEWKPK